MGYITVLQVRSQTSSDSSYPGLASSSPFCFSFIPLRFPEFPSVSLFVSHSLAFFQPTFCVHPLPLLQFLISGVVTMISPTCTYSHIYQYPRGSSLPQRILLKLILNVKQCSIANSLKALLILGFRPLLGSHPTTASLIISCYLADHSKTSLWNHSLDPSFQLLGRPAVIGPKANLFHTGHALFL